jgi:hypothetical protein
VSEAFESLFKNTQLIVIIDDEDPAFFHQAPILTVNRGENSIGCTKMYRHPFEIYQKSSIGLQGLHATANAVNHVIPENPF